MATAKERICALRALGEAEIKMYELEAEKEGMSLEEFCAKIEKEIADAKHREAWAKAMEPKQGYIGATGGGAGGGARGGAGGGGGVPSTRGR